METPLKFEAEKGTAFIVVGESVEINRHDQPVGYIPLSDLLEFAGKNVQTPNVEGEPGRDKL